MNGDKPKPWWRSRTIVLAWVGLALGVANRIWGDQVSWLAPHQEAITIGIMGVTTVAVDVFRRKAKRPVKGKSE